MSSPLSGFTAVPNPQMLAFMPIQSYLMMYFAGAGWQIGKRKVSAIPNDKFNPMSAKDLLQDFTADLRESIPVLERSLQDITPLIRTLIEQYGDFIKVAIDTIPQFAQNVFGGTAGANLASNIQGFDNILKWIKQQFPSLPDAQARLMAVQIDKTNRNLDPTKFQAPDLFLQEKLKQISAKDVASKNLAQIKAANVKGAPLVPQVPKGFKFKAAAGQSQKMERLRLIKLIAQLGKDIKYLDTQFERQHAWDRLKYEQQQLINLLARYSF